MSLSIRSYKQCSREYLIKQLEKKIIGSGECGCCYNEKILRQKLKENGFFSYNKSYEWWEINIGPNFELVYSPIKDE